MVVLLATVISLAQLLGTWRCTERPFNPNGHSLRIFNPTQVEIVCETVPINGRGQTETTCGHYNFHFVSFYGLMETSASASYFNTMAFSGSILRITTMEEK